MMEKYPYRRKHLRAPVGHHLIVNGPSGPQKAKLVNISEGGLLIEGHFNIDPEEGHHVIDRCLANLFIPPKLRQLSVLQQKNMTREVCRNCVLPVRIRPVRLESVEESDSSFIRLGAAFDTPDSTLKSTVAGYVESMRDNLFFLQSLLDSLPLGGQSEGKIFKVAKMLGYDGKTLDRLSLEVSIHAESLQWHR